MTMLALLAALLFQASPQTAAPGIASELRAGMHLVYGSAGQTQPPWVVESVQTAAPLKEGADCARVSIRRQPTPAPVDDARLCVEAGVVYALNPKTNAWQPQRPIGPNMSLVLPGANGGSVRYETGSAGQASIGPLRLQFVDTVVTTLDASGGWRTQQVFELTEVRFPQ